MKERDDLPDVPIVLRDPGEPHLTTASGLARLHEQRAAAKSAMEKARLDAAIAAAVVVEPPVDTTVAAFGASVRVAGVAPEEKTYTIVGTDEADLAAGRISVRSPLADALVGARAGDRVRWHRPIGDVTITVLDVQYR